MPATRAPASPLDRVLIPALALALVGCSDSSSGRKPSKVVPAATTLVTEGDVGSTDTTFKVTLSKQAKKDQTITFTTVDGTALAGLDYTAVSGSLVIAKGLTEGDITIPILGDTLSEGDEAFEIELTRKNQVVRSTITIRDDDAPLAAPLSVGAGGIKTLSFSWPPSQGASHYRLLRDPDGLSGLAQVGSDIQSPQASLDLTVPVHLLDWSAARFALEACNNLCTQSAPVGVAAWMIDVIGYGKPSNPEAGDGYGRTVVVSGDGGTLAVGAPAEDSSATGLGGDRADNGAPDSGAVYVYSNASGTWALEAYVKSSNSEAGDGFGSALALSFDGSTLAVGATGEDSGVAADALDNSQADSGAVYVFTRSAGLWTEEGYLKPASPLAGDGFGTALALSSDGDTLATGAPFEDGDASGGLTEADSGAAYVFARSGSGWAEGATLKASNAQADDHFGAALALSPDGSTLAVGAPGEDGGDQGLGGDPLDDSAQDAGAVFVFARSGSSWTEELYAKASNAERGDGFGFSVSLSGNGDVLLVGAVGEDGGFPGINGASFENDIIQSGAAYLFTRSVGAWTQDLYVNSSNPDAFDRFGASVALSEAGDLFAVGATGEASTAVGIGGFENDDAAPHAGAVYVFGTDGAQWRQVSYVKSTNSEADDEFGSAVGLAADGQTLIVGAPLEDGGAAGFQGPAGDNSAVDAGAFYLY